MYHSLGKYESTESVYGKKRKCAKKKVVWSLNEWRPICSRMRILFWGTSKPGRNSFNSIIRKKKYWNRASCVLLSETFIFSPTHKNGYTSHVFPALCGQLDGPGWEKKADLFAQPHCVRIINCINYKDVNIHVQCSCVVMLSGDVYVCDFSGFRNKGWSIKNKGQELQYFFSSVPAAAAAAPAAAAKELPYLYHAHMMPSFLSPCFNLYYSLFCKLCSPLSRTHYTFLIFIIHTRSRRKNKDIVNFCEILSAT